MGTVIAQSLNFPVLSDNSPADIANIPYAGIQIDTSSSQIDIWGIDAGITCFAPADYALILNAELVLQSNVRLDPAAQADDLGVAGNLRYFQSRRTNTQDYDLSRNFTSPIPLLRGTVYACWLFLRPTAAFAGLTRIYLNLRGGFSGGEVFPYKLGR